MRQDFLNEEPGRTPLSTAALAHATETATAPNDLDRSPGGPRDRDRPPVEDDLVESGTRPGVMMNRDNNGSPAKDQTIRDSGATDPTSREEEATPLFSETESKDLFSRWDSLQVGFIDEPRQAVQQADNLVAGTMKRLAEIFAQERAGLEGQWDRGDNVSTEDLRVAMRRYRSFFRRLLAV